MCLYPCARPVSVSEAVCTDLRRSVYADGLSLGAFDGAVDGGPSHGEQLGQLRHGVIARGMELVEVGFLLGGQHEAIGLRTEDAFINLVEVPKENWSFGSGLAQYADE